MQENVQPTSILESFYEFFIENNNRGNLSPTLNGLKSTWPEFDIYAEYLHSSITLHPTLLIPDN